MRKHCWCLPSYKRKSNSWTSYLPARLRVPDNKLRVRVALGPQLGRLVRSTSRGSQRLVWHYKRPDHTFRRPAARLDIDWYLSVKNLTHHLRLRNPRRMFVHSERLRGMVCSNLHVDSHTWGPRHIFHRRPPWIAPLQLEPCLAFESAAWGWLCQNTTN